jgi:hypothetical protein
MKKLLDRVAYVSLFFDIAIAMITLVSLKILSANLSAVLAYVNYGLTFIVLLSVLLFVLITVLSYYDKIVDNTVRRIIRKG